MDCGAALFKKLYAADLDVLADLLDQQRPELVDRDIRILRVRLAEKCL